MYFWIAVSSVVFVAAGAALVTRVRQRRSLYVNAISTIVTVAAIVVALFATFVPGTNLSPSQLVGSLFQGDVTGYVSLGLTVVSAVLAFVTALVPWLRRSRLDSEVRSASRQSRDVMSPELFRVMEWAAGEPDAERELMRHLPPNPRRAKRMVNHSRLLTQIAKDRRIFGGEPELTERHLTKWVILSEHWPALTRYLTSDPGAAAALETANDLYELADALSRLPVRVAATEDLLAALTRGVRLTPVLERLVRFESAPSLSTLVTQRLATTR
jgi:hypothetical protein